MTEVRRITDAEALKALAHPLRQRLLRLLSLLGSATVGTLAAKTESDPGQVSYHLRKLAEYGFIEAAPERLRDFRQTWWKPVPVPHSWSAVDFESPAGRLVADTVKAQWVREQFEAVRRHEHAKRDFDPAWRDAATASQSSLYLSPEETVEMVAELQRVCERWSRRSEVNRGTIERDPGVDGGFGSAVDAEREHVRFFYHAFPERL